MTTANPTFEEVDKHIQSADLSVFAPGGKHHVAAAAAPAAALPNICPAYKIIRPILQLLLGVPLIPSSWKAAIKVFMQVLDAVCP